MGNSYWSKEEKLMIIKRVLNDYKSTEEFNVKSFSNRVIKTEKWASNLRDKIFM